MAEAIIRVIDETVQVVVSGSSLLTPLVNAAAASAAQAQESAADANTTAIGLAQTTTSNYYSTVSGGVAATAVDDIFASDEFGDLAYYRHTSSTPYHKFLGTAPLSGVHLTSVTDAIPFDGVFFDTSAGDVFTALSTPIDAALTVNAASITFNSATQTALDCLVKDASGNVVSVAFDETHVDATVTVTSFHAANEEGFFIGLINSVLGRYATEIKAHPSSAAIAFARVWNAGSALASDASGYAFSAPFDVRVQYRQVGNTITGTISYPSTVDHVLTLTQVFTATSYETPRMFNSLGVRFRQGNFTLKSLSVTCANAGATFGLLGDSLTQGRFASTYANAWAQRLKTLYPGRVLPAGAPSSTTADWLSGGRVAAFARMAPRFAFVCLGVNDLLTGRTLAAIEADYTSIMTQLKSAGVTPIAITVPPIGNANVPTLNTWIKAQGWPYIDIYPLLVGTGTALSATYSSGDGVHWNDAGHGVVYTAVTGFITAYALADPGRGQVLLDPDATLSGNSNLSIATQRAVKDYVDSGQVVAKEYVDSEIAVLAIVSARAFGAVGDGVTDDTAALQAFLDYICLNARRGYLPAGTYLHTGLNTYRTHGWSIIGDGPRSTSLKCSVNNVANLTVGGKTGGSGQLHSIELRDFNLDYSNTQPSTNTAANCLVLANMAYECRLQSIHFLNGYYGIHELDHDPEGQAWGQTWDDLWFEAGLTGGAVNGSLVTTQGAPNKRWGRIYVRGTNMTGPAVFYGMKGYNWVIDAIEINGLINQAIFDIQAGGECEIRAIKVEGFTFNANITNLAWFYIPSGILRVGMINISGGQFAPPSANYLVRGATVRRVRFEEVITQLTGASSNFYFSTTSGPLSLGVIQHAGGNPFPLANNGGTATANDLRYDLNANPRMTDDIGNADYNIASNGGANIVVAQTALTSPRSVEIQADSNYLFNGYKVTVLSRGAVNGVNTIAIKAGGVTKATIPTDNYAVELTWRRNPTAHNGWVVTRQGAA